MQIKKLASSRSFIGRKVNLMLDRAPAWPHIGLGDAQISSLDEKSVKIDGTLNGLGLDGTFLYEVSEATPGSASVRIKIDSNCINVDVSKVIPYSELGAGKIELHNGSSIAPLAQIDYRGGSVMPRGLELFDCHNDPDFDCYRMHFDYD